MFQSALDRTTRAYAHFRTYTCTDIWVCIRSNMLYNIYIYTHTEKQRDKVACVTVQPKEHKNIVLDRWCSSFRFATLYTLNDDIAVFLASLEFLNARSSIYFSHDDSSFWFRFRTSINFAPAWPIVIKVDWWPLRILLFLSLFISFSIYEAERSQGNAPRLTISVLPSILG